MSTTNTPPTRLVVIALDVTSGDGDALDAHAARVAQVFRYGAEAGVTVGDVQTVCVEGVTAQEFFAAIRSLKATHV